MMKLVTIEYRGRHSVAVVIARGYVALDILNEEKRSDWPTDMKKLVESGDAERLASWYRAGGETILENMSRALIVTREEAEIKDGPVEIGAED